MPFIACERCSQPATRFFKLVAGGAEQRLALCASCATSAMLTAVLPATSAGLSLTIPLPRGRSRCPVCKFRWSDFERTQRLGCPACYEAHQSDTLPLIARHQPEVKHCGRKPGTPVAPLQRELEGIRPPTPATPAPKSTAEIERQLAAAVAREDYEAAALWRDRLSERRRKA